MNVRKGGLIALALLAGPAAGATPFIGEMTGPGTMHSRIADPASGRKYVVEIGFEYLHPKFDDFSNIVTENPDPSVTTDDVRGNFAHDYPDVFAQTLKVQAVIGEASRTTVSLKTYLPLNSMSQLDTGYIYLPEFVLYRAEAQRPRIQIGAGTDLSENVRVGLGLDVGFAVNGTANVFLQSGAGRYSDQRIAAKLKPSLIPQASLQVGDYQFIVRGENKAMMKIDADVGGRFFGGGAGIDFTYVTESALYFDPWSFELHGRNALTSEGGFAVTYGLAYQLWSRYQARAAIIADDINNNCNGNSGCTPVFARTQTPEFDARNLFVPQVGIELLRGDNRYELGYRFKDSIFRGVPTGNTNYLDPPRHDFWLGATFALANGWQWGANLQVSRLVPQTVLKSNASSIGGPGYTAAGWLMGGGVRLTLPF
jgi:hypothetical protein